MLALGFFFVGQNVLQTEHLGGLSVLLCNDFSGLLQPGDVAGGGQQFGVDLECGGARVHRHADHAHGPGLIFEDTARGKEDEGQYQRYDNVVLPRGPGKVPEDELLHGRVFSVTSPVGRGSSIGSHTYLKTNWL